MISWIDQQSMDSRTQPRTARATKSKSLFGLRDRGNTDETSGTPAWDTFLPECNVPVDEYFWLNSLHPTHKVHKEVARRLVKQL